MRVKHIEVEVPARLVLRGTIPEEADAMVVIDKARDLIESGTVPFVTGPTNHLGVIGSISYYSQRGSWDLLRFEEMDAGVATAAEIQKLRNDGDEREPQTMVPDGDPLTGYEEEIPDFSQFDISPDHMEALTCILPREGDTDDNDGVMRLACLVEWLIADGTLTTEQGLLFFRAVINAEASRVRRDEYRRKLVATLDKHATVIDDIRGILLRPSLTDTWLVEVSRTHQNFATIYETIVASYCEQLSIAESAIPLALDTGSHIDAAAIQSGAWRPGQDGTAQETSQNGAGGAEQADGDTALPPA